MEENSPNTSPYSIQPLMLSEPIPGEVSDLCLKCISQANQLNSKLHPKVAQSIGDLVRTMNCYYSNLIEGHNTHPLDIERALTNHLSDDPKIRDLQQEAVAHIHLQRQIDYSQHPFALSPEYLLWLHQGFYQQMPKNFSTGIIPGKLRQQAVQVGNHIAPAANCLSDFLTRAFSAFGANNNLSQLESIVATAASHHRLLWIHPFLDGNGRVIRLFSHAFLKSTGIGSSLWSISRGLARNAAQYKAALANADETRLSDLDGRGNLSEKMLIKFCVFFLETCLDQINFMKQLIEPEHLLARIKVYTEEQKQLGILPEGSFSLLREAFLRGEFPRGQATKITGFKERKARSTLKACLEKKLLTSDTEKSAVRLNFSIDTAKRWLPSLFAS